MDLKSDIPLHLGLILDGNRRWAIENNLPKLEGHKKGSDTLKTITQAAFKRGVKFVSAYTFSTENWNRTKEEVGYLMNLTMKIASEEMKQLIKENIKIVILGIEEKVPKKVLESLRKVEEDSKNNTGGTLALCFNYGGLREIADAVKKIVAEGVDEEEITEDVVVDHLYHPEIPPVDLMIRTSGEQRISNFMLARMAYAEMYFTPKRWPEFSEDDLDDALADYAVRMRRYGA